METETVRPDFLPLTPLADAPRNEAPAPSVCQLKQDAHPRLENDSQKHTSPSPDKKTHQPNSDATSPHSEDPTTERDDISESLVSPEQPSSPSAPIRQPPKQPTKSLEKPIQAHVKALRREPAIHVKKLASPGKDEVRRGSYVTKPCRPITSFDDGESSDEDEDYRHYCRKFLRRKSDLEMTAPTPQAPVVEVSKKGRSTRQASVKVQKRKGKEVLKDIPFSDPKYSKIVGHLVLPQSDIARDLAAIYGREFKESSVEAPKANNRSCERKRGRSSDLPTQSAGFSQGRRTSDKHSSSAEQLDMQDRPEAGRATRSGKRSAGNALPKGGLLAERAASTSSKRQKTSTAYVAVAEVDQKKMFEKHPDRKGWVVCKKCMTAVWPPNCGKHLFHCRKE